MKRRKRRSDRAYLLYKVVCTINLMCYVGLVVRTGQAVKRSLARRLEQHRKRALELGKDWLLHQAIREYGPDAFTIELIEVVRGKGAAHQRELELMIEHNATLNTAVKRR